MANNKNEKWDGYFKKNIKDPIWWDAIPEIKATELTADTTRKFVKASGEAWNSTQTMNPRIAFLDAIGQLDYQDNFYIATESLHSNEDKHGMVLIKVKDAITKAISDINGYTVQDQINYPEPPNELTFYSGDKDDDVYKIEIKKVRN